MLLKSVKKPKVFKQEWLAQQTLEVSFLGLGFQGYFHVKK
jgi:hypothetical protein